MGSPHPAGVLPSRAAPGPLSPRLLPGSPFGGVHAGQVGCPLRPLPQQACHSLFPVPLPPCEGRVTAVTFPDLSHDPPPHTPAEHPLQSICHPTSRGGCGGGSAVGDGGCSAPRSRRWQAAIMGRDGRTVAQGACPAGTEVLGAGTVMLPLRGAGPSAGSWAGPCKSIQTLESRRQYSP